MRNTIARTLLSLVIAAFLTATAQAQSPTPASPQPAPSTATIKLTMEDQHVLKENLLKGAQSEGSAAGQTDIERGKTVPASVTLHHFPDEIASKIPQIKSHEYFIADHAIVIVEPQKRSVVEVIK